MAGIRSLDPDSEFGVLEGLLLGGSARQVTGSWVLAPPGLLRLTTYPRQGVELALPQADELMLAAADGSRYGFRGWVTVRIRLEKWEELHAACAGAGLRGALVHALRRAGELRSGSEHGPLTATVAHDLEQRLGEELGAVGIDLRRLELASVDFLAVDEGQTLPPTDARLLIVGLDGADWEIIDPLIEQGRLPNLELLVEGGARAKLLSISPMLSPVIWTSIATGVEPSRHGVLDFMVQDADGGQRQPVTSAQRKVPTFWELLSDGGVDVGVVGWWASWPADPVRGYLVSDRIAYQLFGYRSDPGQAQGKTWPPELYDTVRPAIVAPDSIDWERVRPYLDGQRTEPEQFDEEERQLLDELRTLIASGETYLGISRTLQAERPGQLEIVYFEGTDTVGHLFMPYRLPHLAGVAPERIASFSQVVDRYYETADAYLGQLLQGRDESWTVMLISDHGFATDSTRPRTTDSRIGHGGAADWHRRFGILVLSGAHVEAGIRIDEASIYDIAPTVMALFGQPIPKSWRGRVLGEAIAPAFLEEHPVRYRHDEPPRVAKLTAASEAIDPAAADLVEKLQNLGYVGSGGEGSESMTARNNAGVALLAEGRYADAEAEFRAGLEAQPRASMLRFNLAMALRFQGRTREARELFEGVLEDRGTMRMAGLMLAQMSLAEGDLDAAEALARRVLEREPDASELHNLLGRVLEDKGDLAAARRSYLQAAELDPDVSLPRNNLGNLAKREGNRDEAERWYLAAIDADPYFMGAYNNLALVYQDRGEMQKAIDLYDRALAKAPNNAELLNNVASWYFANGDNDQARKLWSRAIMVAPEYPSPLNNLAGMAINAGKLDEAERLLRRAISLDPNYGDARINLALLLRRQRNDEGARAELQAATDDPRAAQQSWAQLGLLELELGYVESASAALEQAIRVTPRITQLHNALGEAYRLQGRTRDAIATWRISLALDPGQEQLRRTLEQLEQR